MHRLKLMVPVSGMMALMASLQPATAGTDGARACLDATRKAAAQTEVPLAILQTIALAESGRPVGGQPFQPWPWTVHARGKGHWFDTPQQAISFVQTVLDGGERNIDIGCFQLNYRWHGEAFDSLAQMFDPASNATYAAKFLGNLRQEAGSWKLAAGAYHSRTQTYADRYIQRLEEVFVQNLSGEASEPAPPEAPLTRVEALMTPRSPLILTRVRPLIGARP